MIFERGRRMSGCELDHAVMEVGAMDTLPNATRSRSVIPVWYKIGAIFVLMIVVVLFFVFAGVIGRRRINSDVPPGGAVPGRANPVLPQ
jgi:hypothetical protein